MESRPSFKMYRISPSARASVHTVHLNCGSSNLKFKLHFHFRPTFLWFYQRAARGVWIHRLECECEWRGEKCFQMYRALVLLCWPNLHPHSSRAAANSYHCIQVHLTAHYHTGYFMAAHGPLARAKNCQWRNANSTFVFGCLCFDSHSHWLTWVWITLGLIHLGFGRPVERRRKKSKGKGVVVVPVVVVVAAAAAAAVSLAVTFTFTVVVPARV